MRKLTVLAAALALVACDQSKPELEKTLVQVQTISAQKDSLLKDVLATSQFIADLNTEVGKVRNLYASRPKNGAPGETEDSLTLSGRRAIMLQKVRELATRLNTSEARLATSRKKMAELAGADSGLKVQLAQYDSTIASFKSIIENQKSDIANLMQQVSNLNTENTQLKTDNVQLVGDKTTLTGERDQLTTEKNTVYYVVGTKQDLLRRHLIEQSGGTLGLGKTQVPARILTPSDFTPMDKTKTAEIPLPKANTPYKIVTRQDLGALDSVPDKNGRVMNTLKIRDADGFWAASKFLIVMEP